MKVHNILYVIFSFILDPHFFIVIYVVSLVVAFLISILSEFPFFITLSGD